MALLVEVCVQGIEAAIAAQNGGAGRVELCEDIAVGGVTPGAGVIGVARERLAIPVHVLIRPRGGNFVYTDAEFDVMRRDSELVKTLGAAGVVLGILHEDGSVDLRRTSRLIDDARPLSITFHKAFDETSDPFTALEQLIDLGVERVLTAGGKPLVSEGLDRLAELARKAKGRIIVMPGGRIRLDDVPALVALGFEEIHVGSAACADGRTDAGKVRWVVDAGRINAGSSVRDDGAC